MFLILVEKKKSDVVKSTHLSPLNAANEIDHAKKRLVKMFPIKMLMRQVICWKCDKLQIADTAWI